MLPPVSAASFVPYQDRAGYISIGNFRHAPNWDAVLHLKSAIWPLIRRSQPDAQLSVYGAYPPPKATRLDDPETGFRVKGWAADVRKVMAQARICLAPLRFGAGLKGKLVDAMTCGTPNVTSAIGAEAMHADLPWSGAISDDPEGFAQSAVKLYRSDVHWRTAQANGATIINTLFADGGTGQRLLERIADLQQGLAQHRLKNFTGAMLRHHTLQSTRYMAQWIEEKNRRKAQP
jgi:glycosyltransferase involved in cell wall biosynthesis